MRPASAFYASFARAGFLVPCTWGPRTGGASASALVRFRRPTLLEGGEQGVIGWDTSASWPASVFPQARQGDTLRMLRGATSRLVPASAATAPWASMEGVLTLAGAPLMLDGAYLVLPDPGAPPPAPPVPREIAVDGAVLLFEGGAVETYRIKEVHAVSGGEQIRAELSVAG